MGMGWLMNAGKTMTYSRAFRLLLLTPGWSKM